MAIPTLPTVEELKTNPIVNREAWLEARKQLLAEEKAALKRLDEISAKRRALPWVSVEKDYRFRAPEGEVSLSELFRGRSQLIIYHFMFGPGWEEGCDGCSFFSDHVDGARQHFEHNDVAFTAVSRGELAEFLSFKERMGWKFPWVSSAGSNFNFDYGVSFTPEQVATGEVGYNFGTTPYAHEELHGLSVFYKKPDGSVFHTYSTYARGVDILTGALQLLDLVPKGRNESGTMDWVRLHDLYETESAPDKCGCGEK